MATGLRIRDANNIITYDTSSISWSLLGSYTASANTSVTIQNIPEMGERLVTRLMVDQTTGDDESYIHTYSLSGTTLTITAPSSTDTVETLFMVYGR